MALPNGMAPPSQAPEESISGQVLDLDAYAARGAHDPWPDGASPPRSFTLRLDEATTMPSSHNMIPGMRGMPGMNTRYTINGAVFPRTSQLSVQQGDWVEITFANTGQLEHAMHLHGHDFRLLARDGKPLPGALVMDTILVEPGSSYTIGFVVDNPGWWAIHCHELHHAAGGHDGAPSLRRQRAPGAAGRTRREQPGMTHTPTAPPHRIDVHHHVFPAGYVRALRRIGVAQTSGVPLPRWDAERA